MCFFKAVFWIHKFFFQIHGCVIQGNSLFTHAFVKLTNFRIWYLGYSTVHITESGKVISKICIFLSFSETVCFVVRRLCWWSIWAWRSEFLHNNLLPLISFNSLPHRRTLFRIYSVWQDSDWKTFFFSYRHQLSYSYTQLVNVPRNGVAVTLRRQEIQEHIRMLFVYAYLINLN
jgi:hypothetical protein